MNAYYSILQVPLRVEADEKLSLGLLLRDGDQIFFQYSDLKLKLLKSLLPKTAFKLLNHTLKDTLRLFEEQEKISTSQYQLIETPSSANQFSREEYIAYLSQYNNNLLTFTSPIPFSLPANAEVFHRLFKKMVSDEIQTPHKEERQPEVTAYLIKEFYPKIEENVDLDVELSSTQIPSLFLPLKVNFIGKNDAPLVGKEIDFDKAHYFLEHDLTKLYTLVKAFEESGEEYGKYYSIGKEPSKEHSKNHAIWETISRSKTVEFVEYREVDRIVEYIDKHKILPFLSE